MSSLQNSAADPRCVTKLRSSRPESTTQAPCWLLVVSSLLYVIVSVSVVLLIACNIIFVTRLHTPTSTATLEATATFHQPVGRRVFDIFPKQRTPNDKRNGKAEPQRGRQRKNNGT